MEDFRIVLIIAGGLAILAVLVHGLRTMKRQQPPKFKEAPVHNVYQETAVRDGDGFCQDGVGVVRVTKTAQKDPAESVTSPVEKVEPVLDADISLSTRDDEPVIDSGTLSAVSTAVERPVPKKNTEIPAKPATVVEAEPVEPVEPEMGSSVLEPTPAAQQEVLVLNVVAKAGDVFFGPMLEQALGLAGFRFGEMDIYHCHADANGQGPSLFSVINMTQPGTFQPEGMKDFATQGISIFMVMPGAGEPAPTFELMFDAAQALASHLCGDIQDEKHQTLTADSLNAYRQRIAQFEHKQLQQAS